jgi:hypothetical protein
MKLQLPQTTSEIWKIGLPVFLIALMIVYFTMGLWYKNQYGRYRSTKESINQLLTIRRHTLGEAIDPLAPNNASICSALLSKSGIYSQIKENETAMVNWRPLSVRVAGYLGGDITVRDGVFDMAKGIQLALSLGARCFIFDIDYLDDKPCEPVVIHRDENGIMRSLHTGSVYDGMDALRKMAFSSNYDPVIVVVYLRRIPAGKTQKSVFFKNLASYLDPLTTYHLGSTEQGNFHNCRSESSLFTTEITNFQKKFIVLCNYNTNLLASTPNPKDNLDFWVNARLYVDESGKSSTLGNVSASVPNGQVPYAQVGSTQQLLMIPDSDKPNYKEKSSNTFKIALSPVDYVFTVNQVTTLVNALGIQCVPIDVVRLGATQDHVDTLMKKAAPIDITDLSNPSNPKDVLSFWTHSGWSRKLIIEGFEDTPPVPAAAPIPGFIIPKPVTPKKPPPSTNSNGGLVSIA